MPTATDLARAYWDSEESRDIDRILAHFTPDATWSGPEARYRGVTEFRLFYEDSIAQFPQLSLTILETLGEPSRAALRWTAILTSLDGVSQRLDGVNFMTFDGGLITDLATFFSEPPASK
jgi:ketosteroid isomerase-like protein